MGTWFNLRSGLASRTQIFINMPIGNNQRIGISTTVSIGHPFAFDVERAGKAYSKHLRSADKVQIGIAVCIAARLFAPSKLSERLSGKGIHGSTLVLGQGMPDRDDSRLPTQARDQRDLCADLERKAQADQVPKLGIQVAVESSLNAPSGYAGAGSEFFKSQAAVQAQGIEPIGEALKVLLPGDVFAQGDLPELEASSKADERDRRCRWRWPALPKARSGETSLKGANADVHLQQDLKLLIRVVGHVDSLGSSSGCSVKNAVASLVSPSPNAVR